MKLKDLRKMNLVLDTDGYTIILTDLDNNLKYELRGDILHKYDEQGNLIPQGRIKTNKGQIPPDFSMYSEKQILTSQEKEDFLDKYEDLIFTINNCGPSGVSSHYGESLRQSQEDIPNFYKNMKNIKCTAEKIANQLNISLSSLNLELSKLSKIKLDLF